MTGVTIFTANTLNTIVYNIAVDGASGSSTIGFDVAAGFGGNRTIRCKASNCTTGFQYTLGGPSLCLLCEATGCNYGFNVNPAVWLFGCTSHGNTVGFYSESSILIDCLAYSNSGDGFVGPSGYASTLWLGCTSSLNGGDGFHVNTTYARNYSAVDCVATGNTGYGFDSSFSGDNFVLYNCAGWSNTSGNVNSNILANFGFVTLTADPFVAASSGNFAPNSTSGGARYPRCEHPWCFPGRVSRRAIAIWCCAASGFGGRVNNYGPAAHRCEHLLIDRINLWLAYSVTSILANVRLSRQPPSLCCKSKRRRISECLSKV